MAISPRMNLFFATPSPISSPKWESINSHKISTDDYIAMPPVQEDCFEQVLLPKLSTWSACWTVLNLYVGLGLLSKPYAIAKGGWISVIILAFVTVVANTSAKQLVGCFKTPRCKLARSYAEVVEDVLGVKGAAVLTVFLTLELLATVSICLLFM